MILFQNDWLKYPGAIIDYQTSNKSALKLAAKYRKMGVVNNAFFLALHNPALQGIDPHSPDLTLAQMIAIAAECKQNPWYFFREVARAPSNAGKQGAQVEFNRANVSLWWCFFNHITYTLIQPRQTGKSFCTDLLMSLLMLISCINTQINLLTKGEHLRKANIERLKNIYDELPGYFKVKTSEDANNTETLTVKKYNNTYYTHVPQSSVKRAHAQGRGLTTPIIHIDEPPFQANISESFPAAMGAMGAAILDAKRNEEPYGVILTTTAGQKDDRDGKFVYKFAMESASWSERFFDAFDEVALEAMVRQSSRTDKKTGRGVYRIYGAFSYRQLGKDDNWLRDQLERTASTPEEADRDYFNVWTSGTLLAPLPRSVLELLTRSIEEELYQDITPMGGYILRWFVPQESIVEFMRTRKTVVGVDTSDASGGDDISFVVTDVETGALVAITSFNETNLIKFAQWLVWFICTYVNSTIVIERRSSAAALIDYLLMFLPEKGIDPFKRLFNWVVNDHLEHRDRYAEARLPLNRRTEDLYVRCKKYFGFATSGSGETSRSDLYSKTLQMAAKRCADKLKDRALTEQITGLVNRNGRIDHDVGGHDDLCFIGTTLVRTINGNRPIKDLKIGDLVLTREGYKPIVKLFCSKKEVITQYGMTGTANHPFITPTGTIEFKDITPKTKVYAWNEKQSIIEERTITDILNLSTPNLETTSTDTTNGKSRLWRYTGKLTKMFTVQSQKDTKSIIRTATFLTTRSKISNVLPLRNIANVTRCLKRPVTNKQKKVGKGTRLGRGEKKTLSLLNKLLLRMVANLKVPLIGEKKTLSLLNKSTPQLEEKVLKQENRKELVYNIMVADCHEYFVNDILVHNCIGWLLTHWFLTMGKNLQHYGIDARTVMIDYKGRAEQTPEQVYYSAEQQQIRQRIEKIYDDLTHETDSYVCEKLERELRFLDSRIVLEEGESFSVDAMIQQAKAERRSANNAYVGMETSYYERLGYVQPQHSGDYGLSPVPRYSYK